jgi:tetratricopeptide (TPR) repeat protein
MLPPRPTELSEGATDATFERFLTESRERSHRGDYARSLEAARRAVARARDLRSTELSVRAAEREANTLSLSGCGREAAERLGSILSLVNERPRSLRLTDRRVAHAVVCAHLDWVSITGFIDPVPVQRRFEVLDRTEALLMEMGRPDWRSGVLGMRATLLRSLCRYEEAIPLSAHAIRTFSEGAPGSTLASYRQQHADTLFDARRISEAEIEYRAIVTDARRSVRDEKSAHVGLARCALRRGELAVARQHAEEAVRIAKPLSDSALCGALHVLAEVLEKSDELDHAVAVADQLVEKARKTKSPQRLFFAIRSQIDIALAREDGESARSWLEGAERLASLLDGKGGSGYAAQLRGRRERIDSESV